jgi:hypothetical protein
MQYPILWSISLDTNHLPFRIQVYHGSGCENFYLLRYNPYVPYFLALKMEAKSSSEISVDYQRTGTSGSVAG